MAFGLAFQAIGTVFYLTSTAIIAVYGATYTEAEYAYWGHVPELIGNIIVFSLLTLGVGGLALASYLVFQRMSHASQALAVGDTTTAQHAAKPWIVGSSYLCGGLPAGLFFSFASSKIKALDQQEGGSRMGPSSGQPGASSAPAKRPLAMAWTRSLPERLRRPAKTWTIVGCIAVAFMVAIPAGALLGGTEDFRSWFRAGVSANYETFYYGPGDETPRETGLIKHEMKQKLDFFDMVIEASVTGSDPLALGGTWIVDELNRKISQWPSVSEDWTRYYLWIPNDLRPGDEVEIFDMPFTVDDSFMEHGREITQVHVIVQGSEGFHTHLLTYYADNRLLRSLDMDLEDGGRFRMEPSSLEGTGPPVLLILLVLGGAMMVAGGVVLFVNRWRRRPGNATASRGLIEHRITHRTGWDDEPSPTASIDVSVTGPDPLRLDGTWTASEHSRDVHQAPHSDQYGTNYWLWIPDYVRSGDQVRIFDRPFTADDTFTEHGREITQLSVIIQDSTGFRADLVTYYSDLLLLRSLDVDLEDGGGFVMEPHLLTGSEPTAPVVVGAIMAPTLLIGLACYGISRIRR